MAHSHDCEQEAPTAHWLLAGDLVLHHMDLRKRRTAGASSQRGSWLLPERVVQNEHAAAGMASLTSGVTLRHFCSTLLLALFRVRGTTQGQEYQEADSEAGYHHLDHSQRGSDPPKGLSTSEFSFQS